MSTLYNEVPPLGYADTVAAVAACVRAKRTPMVMGAPGIGKSSMAKIVADAFGLPLVTQILSNCDPTDVAGLPMLNKQGKVEMHPFPTFRQAIEEAVCLFVDEFTAIRRSVEAPAMRLMLEHNVGGTPMHHDSILIGACNSPEHCPSGIELSAAMVNRLIWLRYEPTFKDVSSYFQSTSKGLTPDNVDQAKKNVKDVLKVDYQASLALELADFSATASHQPDLIQLNPPPACIANGTAWASPRAWEAGLSAYAALGREATSGKGDAIGFAILTGAVGPHAAAAYLGIRDLRTKLPSVNEIINEPDKAKLPNKELMIASLGLITRAAMEDVGAAFIYLARMPPEIAAAAYRPCTAHVGSNLNKSKHGAKKAVEAYSKVSRAIGNAM